MKEKKQKMSLVAKLLGGIAFVAVFALNVVMFVKADGKKLAMSSLTAYAEGECGWICPTIACTEPTQPSAGNCAIHGTQRVAHNCPPEVEEEEVPTGYETEVSTPVAQYSELCTWRAPGYGGSPWHRTRFCTDISCEGSGSVTCVAGSTNNCYWGECW